MTNLDSVLKCRDISLPIAIYIVKGMIFPVVIYGCESWTIRKAEQQRIDAIAGIHRRAVQKRSSQPR